VTVVNVGAALGLIAKVNVPAQLFVQNQGANPVALTPDGLPGGVQINTGQTLILVVQNPLIPVVSVYGVAPAGPTTLDVQEWPF
jgi:hypothetical protein